MRGPLGAGALPDPVPADPGRAGSADPAGGSELRHNLRPRGAGSTALTGRGGSGRASASANAPGPQHTQADVRSSRRGDVLSGRTALVGRRPAGAKEQSIRCFPSRGDSRRVLEHCTFRSVVVSDGANRSIALLGLPSNA